MERDIYITTSMIVVVVVITIINTKPTITFRQIVVTNATSSKHCPRQTLMTKPTQLPRKGDKRYPPRGSKRRDTHLSFIYGFIHPSGKTRRCLGGALLWSEWCCRGAIVRLRCQSHSPLLLLLLLLPLLLLLLLLLLLVRRVLFSLLAMAGGPYSGSSTLALVNYPNPLFFLPFLACPFPLACSSLHSFHLPLPSWCLCAGG